jgi:hypothetical protein
MSSHCSSVLTDLDSSLEIIRSQLDRLRAGLDVDDNQLRISLTDANKQAEILRNLIRAERPDAHWRDRETLDQLLHELEIAFISRRAEQRRAKLLGLADELEAGRAKHRFDSRTPALNTLRLEAVQELRREAAYSEEIKDLPGPTASEWLHWACSLQDAKDASVLTTLRRDFAAVERFAGEIEESYWISGQAVTESPKASEPSVRPEEEIATEQLAPRFSTPAVPLGANPDRTGEARQGTTALDEARHHSQLQSNTVPSPNAGVLPPADRTGIDPSREPAGMEFQELTVALPGFLSAAAETPPSFGERVLGKKHIITWVVLAGLFVAVAIFAVIYYSHASNGSKSSRTVAEVGVKVDGTVPDSDIQRDVEQRLAALKPSSIRVAVHDGTVTLAGQCSSEEEVQAMTLALQGKGVKEVKTELQIRALNPSRQASSAKTP